MPEPFKHRACHFEYLDGRGGAQTIGQPWNHVTEAASDSYSNEVGANFFRLPIPRAMLAELFLLKIVRSLYRVLHYFYARFVIGECSGAQVLAAAAA